MAGSSGFEGFSREAIDFLAALVENNDRAWFTPRKAEYEALVKRPLEALCTALAERFAARSIPLVADPVRSPFRVYRDTRFSRDKSPYRAAASARFPLSGDRAAEHGRPGGYFHLAPGEIFAGGGIFHPHPEVLGAWRTLVATSPKDVTAVVEDPAFVALFGALDGDRLKRVPAGFPRDGAHTDLLTLKDVTFRRRLGDADVLSPSLPDLLADTYAAAGPFFSLLARASA